MTEKATHDRRWVIVILATILVLSGVIRFWGITRGYPELYVHDEIFEVNRALQLIRGDYDFHRNKSFYFYFLTAFYAVDGTIQVMTGRFGSMDEFVSQSIAHPGRCIVISRIFSVILGLFSVLLVYQLGKRSLPRRRWAPEIVLVAAWSTCGLALWMSKWGFVETCLVCLGLLATFPILRVLENARWRDYVLAAVLIGAAGATKVYGITLLLPLYLAHLMASPAPRWSDLPRRILHPRFLGAFGIFVVVWWALNPAIVGVLMAKVGLIGAHVDFSNGASPAEPTTHFVFYLTHARWNIGTALLLFLGVALPVTIVNRNRTMFALGAFAFTFIFLLGFVKSTIHVYARYLLLALPYVFVLAVYGLVAVTDWLGQVRRGRLSRVALLLPLLVSGYSAWNGLESIYKTGFHKDFVPVEEQVLRWFEDNVAPDARVIVKGEHVWPGNQTVPLYGKPELYREKYERAKSFGGYFKNMEVLPDLAAATGVRRYELTVVDRDDEWRSLDEYLDEGMDFFVIHVEQFVIEYSEKRSARGKTSRARIYDELRASSEIVLAERFEGRTLQGRPKTVEIYRRATS